MTEFLADGPDWHLGSKAGVWLSLTICGDVCSDTLEIHGLTLADKLLKKTPLHLQKTFPDIPCVFQMSCRLIGAAQHSPRMAQYPARIAKKLE